MPTRQNIGLLVRQQPWQFILFTDYSPESVQQECQVLVNQAMSSLNPRYTCILCKMHFPSKLTATTHAHTQREPKLDKIVKFASLKQSEIHHFTYTPVPNVQPHFPIKPIFLCTCRCMWIRRFISVDSALTRPISTANWWNIFSALIAHVPTSHAPCVHFPPPHTSKMFMITCTIWAHYITIA